MSTPQNNQPQTLEEKLAQVASAMKSQSATAPAQKPIACPIDPAERALCEGCQ